MLHEPYEPFLVKKNVVDLSEDLIHFISLRSIETNDEVNFFSNTIKEVSTISEHTNIPTGTCKNILLDQIFTYNKANLKISVFTAIRKYTFIKKSFKIHFIAVSTPTCHV